jgi:AraC family transcriptional regulator
MMPAMKSQMGNGNYFGSASPVHHVSGLRLTERTYPAHFKTPQHSHPEAYFCLILDGISTQSFGPKSRTREPLTTTFYPPNELQSETFGSGGGRIFNVEIDSRWLSHFREHSVIGEESKGFQGGSVGWLMRKLYHEFRRFDQASALMIEGLTFEIIAEASRRSALRVSHTSLWLDQARDILHDQFATNLSLAGIAKLVGVHPVYLASSFRRKYHCTMGEYRQRLRIEFACRELAKPQHSLAQIALAAGFANQAHFSKTFKRLTGMTPASYRSVSDKL